MVEQTKGRHSFSTEQILENNPVYFERNPRFDRNGDFYDIRVNIPGHEGKLVGDARLVFYEDQKNLLKPRLLTPVQGVGLGVALYVAAAETSNDQGYNPLLVAHTQFLEPCAEHVWQSLVRRGLAEGRNDYRDPYRFIRPLPIPVDLN